jgi:hypothetical protein
MSTTSLLIGLMLQASLTLLVVGTYLAGGAPSLARYVFENTLRITERERPGHAITRLGFAIGVLCLVTGMPAFAISVILAGLAIAQR